MYLVLMFACHTGTWSDEYSVACTVFETEYVAGGDLIYTHTHPYYLDDEIADISGYGYTEPIWSEEE